MDSNIALSATDVRPPEVPDVFWLPVELTPGKFMLALPLNATPPMVRLVASVVAVAALPVHDPEEPDVLPVTLPVKLPVTLPVRLEVMVSGNRASSIFKLAPVILPTSVPLLFILSDLVPPRISKYPWSALVCCVHLVTPA